MAWGALVALGAFHGLNPAMGWLFALARGLHERRRGAVAAALGPIALGHAASVGAVAAAYVLVGTVLSPRAAAVGGALALLAAGTARLLRPGRHPRWVGMRVGAPDLALWSFVMATAHGAGLMVLPALGASVELAASGGHAALASAASPAAALAAAAVHTGAMLAVAGALALGLYGRAELTFLRRSWVNVDVLWAAALLVAGLHLALVAAAG